MGPLEAKERLDAFIDSGVGHHTLALVYGRRRIGKSTMPFSFVQERRGFYWEATRGETAIHLARLGEALGEHLGVSRISLDSWEEAFGRLLELGAARPVPVVLDEFGYVLGADSRVDTVIASMLGPAGRQANPGQTRLILCGSAIAVMAALTGGEAALRGKTALEIVMQPHDYRQAAEWLLKETSLALAAKVYAVIGGVIGYATDMVDHDLPRDEADFDSRRCVAIYFENLRTRVLAMSKLALMEVHIHHCVSSTAQMTGIPSIRLATLRSVRLCDTINTRRIADNRDPCPSHPKRNTPLPGSRIVSLRYTYGDDQAAYPIVTNAYT